ncbi:LLM class flavin-dependent oxidoreductase [Nakamurella alba]|uniref:LLM class flavin-dependent oxidoreductase n=1 Tax=Nakamurella alba TaxID=2665158 RepID=UPI0018AB1F6B|nr:LLM class flavin-dependent oxidoreductase [Nakamurella alba]
MHWYLPTAGESTAFLEGGTNVHVDAATRRSAPFRPPSLSYLTQIALSLEETGFRGVLVPTGSYCEDPWVVSSSLLAATRDLQFLVALHPRTATPFATAHRATSLQALSGGRVNLNVVTGEPGAEALRHGDRGDKADQYARTDEYLDVLHRLFAGETVTVAGHHHDVEGATLLSGYRRTLPRRPEVWFGGSSDFAVGVAGRHVDVYLSWLEPPAQLAGKIDRLRGAAAANGRTLRFGIRSWVLSRETDAAAERDALAHLDGVRPDHLASARTQLLGRQSVGQQRGQALLADADPHRPESLWIGENLWGGFGLLAGGPALGLVGSHAAIADRLLELADLGIDEVILSGFPNLEEARWVGEGVLPQLSRRGALARVA